MVDKETRKKLKIIYKCRQQVDKLIYQIEKKYGLEDISLDNADFSNPENYFFPAMQCKSQSGDLNYKEMTNILKKFIKAKVL